MAASSKKRCETMTRAGPGSMTFLPNRAVLRRPTGRQLGRYCEPKENCESIISRIEFNLQHFGGVAVPLNANARHHAPAQSQNIRSRRRAADAFHIDRAHPDSRVDRDRRTPTGDRKSTRLNSSH